VKQVNATTTIAEAEFLRTDVSRTDKEGHYVYFWVDPYVAPFGTSAFGSQV